jgi:hypothetical protein
MSKTPMWLRILAETAAAGILLWGAGEIMPRSMRHGTDVLVALAIFGAFALWSGARVSSVRELCVRAAVLCGGFSTILVVALVSHDLKNTGHLSAHTVPNIFFAYTVGGAAAVVFILLGLTSRAVRRR